MPLRIVWMCWWTLIVIVYIFLYSTVCCACICIEHLSHRLMLTNNQSAAAVRSTKDRKRDTDMSSGLVYPLRCVIGADMQHATCAFFFIIDKIITAHYILMWYHFIFCTWRRVYIVVVVVSLWTFFYSFLYLLHAQHCTPEGSSRTGAAISRGWGERGEQTAAAATRVVHSLYIVPSGWAAP